MRITYKGIDIETAVKRLADGLGWTVDGTIEVPTGGGVNVHRFFVPEGICGTEEDAKKWFIGSAKNVIDKRFA
jgi:hypothetical protein